MNKNLLHFTTTILLAILFLSFKNKDIPQISTPNQFEEINFRVEQLTNTEKNLNYIFILDGLDIKLNIDLVTEACHFTVKNKIVLSSFNYFYDTDLESAIEEIKILKQADGNDIILLVPTFTEEFLSFQLIKLESRSPNIKNGFFEINTHKYSRVRNFYLDNEIILVQNKDSFEISLGDFKYKNDFKEFKN